MRRWLWRLALTLIIALVLLLLSGAEARGESPPPTYSDQTPLPRTGTATYYNPGVMDQVLRNRIAWRQVAPCPECVGYVALLRAGDIGRKVWLRFGDDVVGPVLVIDCATPWDFMRLKDWWAVDVSWEIAQRWQMRGGITVTVLELDPRSASASPTLSPTPAPTPTPKPDPYAWLRLRYWRYLYLFGGEAE